MDELNYSPFVPYQNARFGFRILMPTEWHHSESTNSDGITIRHPELNGCEIRAYAHYAVVETTFTEWILNSILLERSRSGFRLLGQTADSVMIETENGEKKPLECEIVTYELEMDSRLYRRSWLFAQHGNTQFAIRCEAPVNIFDRYLETFERVRSSLTILSPQAKS
jgi:hypothetical protein